MAHKLWHLSTCKNGDFNWDFVRAFVYLKQKMLSLYIRIGLEESPIFKQNVYMCQCVLLSKLYEILLTIGSYKDTRSNDESMVILSCWEWDYNLWLKDIFFTHIYFPIPSTDLRSCWQKFGSVEFHHSVGDSVLMAHREWPVELDFGKSWVKPDSGVKVSEHLRTS